MHIGTIVIFGGILEGVWPVRNKKKLTVRLLMPEYKWNNWTFQTPPLQYIQVISGGGRRVMSDSPLNNITCARASKLWRVKPSSGELTSAS